MKWRIPANQTRILACSAVSVACWALADGLGGRLLGKGFWFGDAFSGATMAGAIAIGLLPHQRPTRANWLAQARRILAVLLIGGLAGAIGGSLGMFLVVAFHLSPLLGWILIGAGAGAAEGLYERSTARLQMGLIGGAAGGLIGGFLFEWIFGLISSRSIAMGRFCGFVALVLCVRVLFELLNRTLCQAWLKVLDGDQAGRMVLLYRRPVVIGRAESATLRLDGPSQNGVDLDHARIFRNSKGRYVLEDNHSRHGTRVNLDRVQSQVELKNGDLIQIGPNSIQFHERQASVSRSPVAEPPKPAAAAPAPSLPTPKPATAPSVAPKPPTPLKPATAPSIAPKPATAPASRPSVAQKPAPGSWAKPPVGPSSATTPPAKPVVVPPKPVVRPEPPKPAVATQPTKPPAPANSRGVQRCPHCNGIVLGNRPYCMVCDRECEADEFRSRSAGSGRRRTDRASLPSGP